MDLLHYVTLSYCIELNACCSDLRPHGGRVWHVMFWYARARSHLLQARYCVFSISRLLDETAGMFYVHIVEFLSNSDLIERIYFFQHNSPVLHFSPIVGGNAPNSWCATRQLAWKKKKDNDTYWTRNRTLDFRNQISKWNWNKGNVMIIWYIIVKNGLVS